MTDRKTYQETHPWITFQLDLRRISYDLWIQLGSAQAKCDQVAGVPLLPEVAAQLHEFFLARGALATTAIEGNTLSEDEALQVLRGTLALPPSKEYLGQEVANVIEACNVISETVFIGEGKHLTAADIRDYNRLVLRDLPFADEVKPGETRQHDVRVGGYVGAPCQDCDYLLDRLCDWLASDFPADSERRIAFGILKSIIAHLYIAWIHPFADGNGRTARLVEFQMLLASGVPSTSSHLLSNFYNQTRSEYYRQLARASQSGGDVLPFIRYAVQGFVDGLDEQIQMIETQQLHVHWINYVHEQFRNRTGSADIRRRRLVLDLTARDEAVPISELRHVSPRIAEAYAGKTEKTVQRDVNQLIEMGLVIREGRGVRIRDERMSAFLPTTLDAD